MGGVPTSGLRADQLPEYDQDVRGPGFHLDTRVVLQAPQHSLQYHHAKEGLESYNPSINQSIYLVHFV